jgi:hypothetical protein
MSVREYTEEFYKVNIRAGYVEDTAEKIAMYMNGLRMDIQDEINMLTPRTMEESYHLALKAEDKIARKKSNRGKGFAKGRGQKSGKGKLTSQRDGSSGSSHKNNQKMTPNKEYSLLVEEVEEEEENSYVTSVEIFGHRSFECPENKETCQRNVVVAPI